jgi:hypothetical protein
MMPIRASWLVVLQFGLLASTANAAGLGVTQLTVQAEVIMDGSLTGRVYDTGTDVGPGMNASVADQSLGDNMASAQAAASATRAVRVGGGSKPVSEFPGTVHALASADIDAKSMRESYNRNPAFFNRGASQGAITFGRARLQYSQIWITGPDAPDLVKNTPIPLEIRVMWTVGGSFSDTATDTGGGTVLFSLSNGQGHNTFIARSENGSVFSYSDFDDAASDALEGSGGFGNLRDPGDYKAIPFEFLAFPNTSLLFTMSAEAGASVSANVTNDWFVSGGGMAFIDPIVRVDPSYPYLDQLQLIVDDGYYIDTQTLYNPLAGTPFETIGVSLINAPYNAAPIPEPHSWVLLLGGVALILARARHTNRSTDCTRPN